MSDCENAGMKFYIFWYIFDNDDKIAKTLDKDSLFKKSIKKVWHLIMKSFCFKKVGRLKASSERRSIDLEVNRLLKKPVGLIQKLC